MLVLAGALGVLAWLFIDQDAQLAAQRDLARQESSADTVAGQLLSRIAQVESHLDEMLRDDRPAGALIGASDAVALLFKTGTVTAWPRERLAYTPDLADPAPLSAGGIGRSDDLEYRRRDYARAIEAFSSAAESQDAGARAIALLGLARNQLNAKETDAALATYARLHKEGEVQVAGMPAALAAGLGALAIHARQKNQPHAEATAQAIDAELTSARWPVTRAAYVVARDEIRPWLAGPRASLPALAEAVSDFWDRRRPAGTSGRSSVYTPAGAVLIVWRSNDAATAAFAMTASAIEHTWLPADARVVLTDDKGQVVAGAAHGAAGRPVIRLASSTSLPWTLQVTTPPDLREEPTIANRRRLLLAGAGVLLALIVVGTWFVGHTVARELAVARHQANFVAAVSHEFRTPLTTLCQMSELLARDRVASDADRKTYYAALQSESRRLHRLVENLLTFGRTDSGRLTFRSEPLELGSLIQGAITEFVKDHPGAESRIQLNAPVASPVVNGDSDALRTLLWNLVDNGLKYSPDSSPVTVSIAARDSGGAEIKVIDRGMGIPLREQRGVFEKFVRGSDALARQIRGTGVGLALARDIARSHGGDITLVSEPSRGSTFTVTLP